MRIEAVTQRFTEVAQRTTEDLRHSSRFSLCISECPPCISVFPSEVLS